MLNKKISVILISASVIGLINIILVYMYETLINNRYDNQLNHFLEKSNYQELRAYTRLKYILGDSLNSLQVSIC